VLLLRLVNVALGVLPHEDAVQLVVVLVVFAQNWYCTQPTPASVAVDAVTVTVLPHVCVGNALMVGTVDACLSILICADVFIVVSTFHAVSVVRYLTYWLLHVVHALHVTFTEVHAVVGVHEPVVSTQYTVVHDSLGVNVTEKSVLLQVLLALSVVTGAVVSIHEIIFDKAYDVLLFASIAL
jgi:hypothetical protein